METEILLNSANGKKSVNTSNGLNINFKGNRKLLPLNDIAETINQHDQYVEERKNCNIIRLTCQVNPICSNVLFNRITEIVANEGTSNAILLNYTPKTSKVLKDKEPKGLNLIEVKGKGDDFEWNNYEAVRDTQLSADGKFVYHCGLDIFNNHLLRSKTFKVICNTKKNVTSSTFNTIADMMRNVKGEQIKETITYPVEANVENGKKDITMHVYQYDDILTYEDTINTKLLTTFDGWVGFENTSKIKSYEDFPNGLELPIERPIMYMNAGDFIDMYPSRDLYSFVPKYNNCRKRIEKNWNYCITYPSSSTTVGFDNIIETSNNLNALKAIEFDESIRSDNGSSQLVVYSVSKHGLKQGDFVNIYKKVGEKGIPFKIIDNAEVTNVVDNFIFTTFLNTTISGDNESGVTISYKKVVNDMECDYYVRIFSKLPNFKYASGDTSSEYEIYKDNASAITLYQSSEYEFENHISRLAFAKNIYTDEVGQLVFTDDIDISNLKDNLGRPLTSIYITFVKNNKGYKEWYGFDNTKVNINNENVEYSHCFGKVTCGIEMLDDEIVDDSSDEEIRKLINTSPYSGFNYECIHTLDNKKGFKVGLINSGRSSSLTDEEISYYEDKHYYGDLCYYDNYNAIEESIQPILHRFNTAQREANDSDAKSVFTSYKYDEIKFDDYDTTKNWELDDKIKSYGKRPMKEGYYYCPHYEIPIKTFDKLQTISPDFLDILSITTSTSGTSVTIKTMQRHFLTVGDKSILFDRSKNMYYHLVTVKGDNDRMFTANVFDENGNSVTFDGSKENCRLFKMDNLSIPSYAKIIKDGTCRLIWRNVINNGLNKSDNTIEEYPFTNGAFYINKRIDIYVRRQDPYGNWNVYNVDDIIGVDVDIENEDNFYKENEITC